MRAARLLLLLLLVACKPQPTHNVMRDNTFGEPIPAIERQRVTVFVMDMGENCGHVQPAIDLAIYWQRMNGARVTVQLPVGVCRLSKGLRFAGARNLHLEGGGTTYVAPPVGCVFQFEDL